MSARISAFGQVLGSVLCVGNPSQVYSKFIQLSILNMTETWHEKMGFLSNKTFEYIYENNKDYVEFSRKHISKPTGTFKLWIKFLNTKK